MMIRNLSTYEVGHVSGGEGSTEGNGVDPNGVELTGGRVLTGDQARWLNDALGQLFGGGTGGWVDGIPGNYD